MAEPSSGAESGVPPTRLRVYVLGAVLLALFCLGLFEAATRIYAGTVIFPKFDAVRAKDRHYYRASSSPLLAYELEPGAELERDGRLLRINKWGIRAMGDDLARNRWRLALLGDSVVFGVQRGEDRTLSSLLQRELDPDGDTIRVLNFGLGGLNLAELVEYLRLKDEIYDVHEVLYQLNLNDLAPRESIYEGADNGLYRMYRRPVWMGRFFVRKGIYRWMKGGTGGVSWYEWMFSGNEDWAYQQLASLADYCRENGIHLSVLILPAGVAYTADGYALEHAHRSIASWLEGRGIPHLSPVEAFAHDPTRYFDGTDHFHDAGNVRMAELMREFLRSLDVERVPAETGESQAGPS